MIPYPAADYKKYVFAMAVNRMRRLEDIIDALDHTHGFHPEVTNDLGYQFDILQMMLWEAAFIDDHRTAEAEERRRARDPESQRAQEAVNTYSDSRPVSTTFHFGDGKYNYVTHVWHPDPLHPDNRPGAVIDFDQEPYPFHCRQLIVTAPGIIDTYDEDDDDVLGDEKDQ